MISVRIEKKQEEILILFLNGHVKNYELIEKEEAYGGYCADVIDENEFFTCEYHLQIHEHLYEFNTWVFCCSIIDDLKQIDSLKKRFNSSHHYFISDLDAFIIKFRKHFLKT